MLNDSYTISSNFRPKKQSINCDVKEFFELFEEFYVKVLSRHTPDFPYKIRDPYGFALLCQDYKPSAENEIKEDISCKKAFNGKIKTPYDSVFKYKFPFKVLLDLLYRGYYFDYDLAINVYNMQKDPLNIFIQIMNGHGFILNRLKPNKKKVGKLMNYAYDSKITLNENKHIDTPYKHYVCDGKTWPCLISRSYSYTNIVRDDVDGFGEGLFVITDYDMIIDVLRINDLWLINTPLENRLKFGFHSRNYEVIPYMKAFSWRSSLDAAKLLGCNKNEGVLVRPCHEDYFKNTWFEWSKESLIYCCLINGELKISGRKSSKPDFYTLDGEEGSISPYEERAYERIWLDDFDIKEFQKVLSLGD